LKVSILWDTDEIAGEESFQQATGLDRKQLAKMADWKNITPFRG
jgi:hypothetical protein